MALVETVIVCAADGFRLQLPRVLASEVANRIAEAANALPKRGLEVCGLLLGARTATGVTVRALVGLECRYAEGPCFRASEAELRTALRPLDDVVGFYRSRNDGLLELDGQDAILIRLLNRAPLAVLVVRQQKYKAGEGTLIVWNGAEARGGEVFSTRPWMGLGRPLPRAAPTVPSLNRVAERDGLLRAATVPGALILALLVGWRIQQYGGLPEDERGGERSAAAVAPLVITPGGQPAPGESGADGAAGKAPTENPTLALKAWIRRERDNRLREIAVRELARIGREDPETLPLLGETARGDASETVRVAALESIARVWKVNAATRSLFEDRARADGSAAVRMVAERELAGARLTVAAPVRTARAFVPPSGATANAPRGELPAPVSVAGGGQKLEIPMLHAPLPTGAPRMVAPVPPQAPAPAPAPADVRYSPPAVLQQSQSGIIPADLRAMVRRETVVAVRVAIDASGKVLRVYPSEATGTTEQIFWSYYANAVRRWTFRPARRNDVPIDGELVLRFRVPGYRGR